MSYAHPHALTHPPIASLVPHQGTMCLLERVIAWNDEHIHLQTHSHRAHDNPLRMHGRLRAIHLCEYGAQAMAVHGALKSQAAGATATPGMLVALRAVTLHCDYIDDLAEALDVEASSLLVSESTLQYAFRVSHCGELLAEGRAAVVLNLVT